ncbi:lysophospholipid acyltransferase LPEAT2-like [Magnolia sinica]|uniref:lysophospholipid acyltransferase LPEAT2-like n=1 Tax=Magnolia sinica TaxID=86752 RepID=UPI0026596E97|nr:lysophospholipid acyltransferase LPEAT2-like [Magnolia sinica]XP_058098023.1 lysophospholipid acyltransferase LPEAT2-like [Magnolia sinica]
MKQPLFQQACIATFNDCDDKGKGYITKQQVISALLFSCNKLFAYFVPLSLILLCAPLGDAIHSAMLSMNDDNVSELFNLFESDNDGAISSSNFMAFLRRNPLLVALFASNSMHCGLIEGGKLVIA